MKKWMMMVLTMLLLFSGCQNKAEKETVLIYIPMRSEPWIKNDCVDEAIQDERIDEVNRILKESGKNYEIEIRQFEDTQSESNYEDIQARIDQLKKLEDNQADITLFDHNVPVYESFEVLDENLRQANGEKIMTELPSHLLEANKINGKVYYIPKITLPYEQFGYSFDSDYYLKNQEAIKKYAKNPVTLLSHLIENYKVETNEVLFLDIQVETLLMESYASIQGTPLFIRREDRKVINPLEDAHFMEAYQLLISAHLQGITGRNYTQEEWDQFYESGKEMISDLNIVNDENTNFTEIQTDRKEISIGDKIPVRTSGYGIMKNSKHKESAFDFLCEMNTNQDIANMLVYGKNPEKDEKGKVKASERAYINGVYTGMLGNDMITDPAIDQKANKRSIVFHDDTLSNTNLIAPVVLEISSMSEAIEELNRIWSDFDSITSNYNNKQLSYHTVEEAMKLFDEENHKLKKAGIDKVIEELQRQVDEYGKDGA